MATLTEKERHRLAMEDADCEDQETLEAGAAILDEVLECTLCGGPLMPMGALGNRQHYNCRNCGMWSSST